jgi:response regulator RpfG family c-di-GMP phosphodiesterase
MSEKRIAYLDDDEESISTLAEVLKELNYKVEHTKTVSGAEKLAVKFEPDLFIVSLDIATSDPTQLMEKAARNKDLNEIPFLFISENFEANTFFEEFEGAEKKGSKFIKKPFKLEDFVDIVEESIGLPSPPKGVFPISIEGQRELINLKKENEILRSETNDLKSKVGEFSKIQAIERAQQLKEMQKEIEKIKKEKESTAEELAILKSDLGKKTKEMEDKEKKILEAKNQKMAEAQNLREELADLKKSVEEDKEKHKKAQNALREFYKPKLANLSKLEEKIAELEEEMTKVRELPEKLKSEIKEKESQLAELQKQIKKEKELKEKLKKTLEEIG